jgi:hypothetical protein
MEPDGQSNRFTPTLRHDKTISTFVKIALQLQERIGTLAC